MLLGDKPTAKDIQDGWWPEAHNQNRINRRVCQCLRLEYIIICSGVEQRLKHVKPHRDDHLPVATIHPDCKYEWVLEKPGLTTPTQYSGIGHWLVFKTYMSFNGKFFFEQTLFKHWPSLLLASNAGPPLIGVGDQPHSWSPGPGWQPNTDPARLRELRYVNVADFISP